jgi:hypothetical protein
MYSSIPELTLNSINADELKAEIGRCSLTISYSTVVCVGGTPNISNSGNGIILDKG